MRPVLALPPHILISMPIRFAIPDFYSVICLSNNLNHSLQHIVIIIGTNPSLSFFKERFLLCSILFIFVNTFQITCMTGLAHLDVDITTLVETDIKVLPESRELDIAIVTLDGDGHFLT